jgi:dTDP-4-dehydrorhamnose 3,5-epimerase
LRVRETSLPGLLILEPRVFDDPRGFFLESYNRRVFRELGIDREFVQDNHSRSTRGVVRGLHYQIRHPQAKLVRVVRGALFDVAVDIRRGSATFGRWVGLELDDVNHRMLYVPGGFAHGFLALSESVDLSYKCSDFYDPSDERGVLWNDPALGIDWPTSGLEVTLSPKDAALPPLGRCPEQDLPILKDEGGRSR